MLFINFIFFLKINFNFDCNSFIYLLDVLYIKWFPGIKDIESIARIEVEKQVEEKDKQLEEKDKQLEEKDKQLEKEKRAREEERRLNDQLLQLHVNVYILYIYYTFFI